MNTRFLRIVCMCVCLVVATGVSAFAQGKGGGPGGGGPGGPPPGGGHGSGGPGGAPPMTSGPGQSSNSTSSQGNGAMHTGLQLGPVGRWWDDKSVVQAIGLRKEQQRQLDTIFKANKPAILGSYKTFLTEQAKLDAIGKDPKADKTRLFAAIDSVSEARAALQKTTAQMLLQIRQKLDADQITKLEKLQ